LEKIWLLRGVFGGEHLVGTLTGTYFKYDKNGLHAVDGVYYHI